MAEQMHETVPAITAASTPPITSARGGLGTAAAAVGVALLASLCCIGPMLFVTLGVGAGFAARFEPLRPAFTVLTVVVLALRFYALYGRRSAPACAPDGSCALPQDRTRDKVVLWVATVIAIAFLTFPQWSVVLL